MLKDDIERYIELRQSLGFKLDSQSGILRAFARFAAAKGDTHLRAATAMAWAAMGVSHDNRQRRLSVVAGCGRFLRAENPAHEVLPARQFAFRRTRPSPYIYTQEELVRLLNVPAQLRYRKLPRSRPPTYVMLFGLIAATGLRISEALNLKLDDLLPDGILRIRQTKFCKSRLVPLHETVSAALDNYLDLRRHCAGPTDLMFVSVRGKVLAHKTVSYVFQRMLQIANIAPGRKRRPRIHDLRHTFATRVLEQCGTRRDAVARHFVALATYLGHGHMAATYWYLQATPELMTDIAAAAEALTAREAT